MKVSSTRNQNRERSSLIAVSQNEMVDNFLMFSGKWTVTIDCDNKYMLMVSPFWDCWERLRKTIGKERGESTKDLRYFRSDCYRFNRIGRESDLLQCTKYFALPFYRTTLFFCPKNTTLVEFWPHSALILAWSMVVGMRSVICTVTRRFLTNTQWNTRPSMDTSRKRPGVQRINSV